jgi:hypothetical protein
MMRTTGAALVLAVLWAAPAAAQGQGHGNNGNRGRQGQGHEDKSKVTVDVALGAVREVLVDKGYEVVRVEVEDDRRVVYYRAGNQGRGRGQGPPMRMVIRMTEERLVLDEAPDGLRVDIGIRLGIRP